MTTGVARSYISKIFFLGRSIGFEKMNNHVWVTFCWVFRHHVNIVNIDGDVVCGGRVHSRASRSGITRQRNVEKLILSETISPIGSIYGT